MFVSSFAKIKREKEVLKCTDMSVGNYGTECAKPQAL